MTKANKIITIGVSPAWDITCQVVGLEWGKHQKMLSQQIIPAGKALNVSRALAWLGVRNIAAGLWGENDYQQMLAALSGLRDYIEIKFTAVPGSTRNNITLLDTAKQRETHLRAESTLASNESLKELSGELETIIDNETLCVLSGSAPDGDGLSSFLQLIEEIKKSGAKVVVDTSGLALKEIVALGGTFLISPNVEELGELVGDEIQNNITAVIKAARKLTDLVKMVLVSMGEGGAILVTQEKAISAEIKNNHSAIKNTVGCGDYLLAGFLSLCLDSEDFNLCLANAIRVATAKARGLTETISWSEAKESIEIEISEL